MKKLILISVLLFAFSSEVLCTSDTLLNKYWTYRECFLERNVRIGTEPGMSMPVESFWHSDCRWDWTWDGYPPDSIHDGFGTQNIGGDQTSYHGQYLAMLATEYGLLKLNNQDADSTVRELYYALKAYFRLEAHASEAFHTPLYTGFFVRTDAPNNFYTKFQDDFIPLDRRPQCTLAEEVKRTYRPDSLTSNFTSQDQVIDLLFGLALVKRYVPSDIMYNGESVLGLAQEAAYRMVKRYYDDNWNLKDPAGIHIGNIRGGEAWPWAYGLDKSWAYINGTGQTFGHYTTNSEDINLKALWDCCADLGSISHFYNKELYSSLVVTSNTKTVNFTYNYTIKDGMYTKPLAQALLFDSRMDSAKSAFLLDTLYKALLDAPINGPCIDVNGLNPDCEMIKGWVSQNRWMVGDVKDRDTISETNNHPANQNGIDYMLGYNLYRLYYNPKGYYNTNHPPSTGIFGNNSNDHYDFTIYPNPSKDKFQVRIFITHPVNISLKVYDLYGRLIIAENEGINTRNDFYYKIINFPEGIAAGMYKCVVEMDGHLLQQSVMKF